MRGRTVSDSRPIGIFDSGLGGLTVAKEIFRIMPREKILYLGDTARFPYGGRSPETIGTFAEQIARFLIPRDIKLLIVACNTASSVGLERVQKINHSMPVIGVVLPGAKASVMRTAEKKIGIIGTKATINAGAYTRAIADIDASIKTYGKPCPLFAPLVEEGLFDSDIARLVAQRYLYPLVDIGIDCLVLGCTHYPLLYEVIQETVGASIQLIDSALWTAKEAQDILLALDVLAPGSESEGIANSAFYATDLSPDFEKSAELFMGKKIPEVEMISLDELVACVKE
ncbi:MAG: glutamate racemase [Chitinivibrionales bacterium]|nr:glutamate racemase [Chitinivibrionales bacterium]